MSVEHISLRLPLKLGYGIGQLSDGIKQAAFTSFLFFYYNQVLGLSGSLAGLAAMLALLVDAITDPMVGQLSDRFRSRWGRRHPFMAFAALFFPVAMFALFAPPSTLSETELFIWMLALSVIVRVLHTFFYIPHLSLGAELVKDYHARTGLISYRIFFAFIGTLLTTVVGFGLFFPNSVSFPNGLLNPENYPLFGLCAGTLAAVSMLVSVISTRSTIDELVDPGENTKAPSALFAVFAVIKTLRLQSFRVLFIAILIFMIISGSMTTLGVYVATYIYGFGPDQLAVVTAAPILGVLFGPKMANTLPKRLGKRRTLALAILCGAGISTLPLILYLAGLYELLPMRLGFLVVFLGMGVGYGFFMAYMILFDSMLSDTIDEHELLSARREEGLFFAARALAQKASYGTGSLLAGLALDVIQFPKGADPGQVSDATLTGLAVFGGPVTLAIFVSTVFFTNRYKLDADRHAEIRSAINARNAG